MSSTTSRSERPSSIAVRLMPVRLRLLGGLGKAELDEQKVGGSAGPTILESTGAPSADALFEIEVVGGLAGIRVRENKP